DIEMELLDVKRREILQDMGRRGVHVAPEHLEETTERRRSEKSGTVQPRLVDSLVLTVAELSAGPVLLGPETAVYLPDTGLSDALFFRLLEKTKIVFGGSVSLFEQVDGKDCIGGGMGVECRKETLFSWPVIKNRILFRENVARIPENSICLWGMKKLVLMGYAINILPKLRLEDNVMDGLWLDALFGEYVSEILDPKDSIWLGRVKRLKLERYAVNLLPKLKLHEDNVMEELWLDACFARHVSKIPAVGDSVCVGRAKSLKLKKYAIKILPLLWLHGDNVMEELRLGAKKEEYVYSILRAEDRTIWLGKVKSLRLERYAVNILPKLKLHEDNVMEELQLDAWEGGDISETLGAKDNSIWLGRVKSLMLEWHTINLLPLLWLHEDSVLEELRLGADRGEYVSEILRADDNSIWLGKVKSMRLEQHAANILPKLKLHADNVMDSLEIIGVSRDMLQKDSWILNKIKTARSALEILFPLKTGDPETEPLLGPWMNGDGASGTTPADGGCFGWKIKQIKMKDSTLYALRGIRSDKSCVLDRFEYTHRREEDTNRIFKSDERFYLGKIKQSGLIIPPRIEKFLIYTLVDEEGNEVLEENNLIR
ncbi:MAG: uncharacterized protein A8A55_2640, partial [Amphiamblys sp. WSBS2006]